MTRIDVPLHTALAVAGAVLIAAYILFGGPSVPDDLPKKKRRKKGSIPGLINLGNTCFLNCILQSLASCSSFIKWMEQDAFQGSSPALLSSLRKLMNVLNNETEENTVSAGEVLQALRTHGWVISPEEQDAHELFHALTSTLYDEVVLMRHQSSSLFNVSWISKSGHCSRNSPTDEMSLSKKPVTDSMVENIYISKEDSIEGSSLPTSDQGEENSTDGNGFVIVDSETSSVSKYEEFLEKENNDSEESRELKTQINSSIISRVPTFLKQNVFSSNTINASAVEGPFRGHLASQLQCAVCGFKNAEQWSTFESLSLFLPHETQWGADKCSLQDLLDAFVRPECVTEVTCDGCTKIKKMPFQTTFTKRLTVGKLPECLCIHIQRTVWLENNSAVKRKDFVVFPEHLNMEPYTYTVSLSQQHALKGGLLGGRGLQPEDFSSSSVSSDKEKCHSLCLHESVSSFCPTTTALTHQMSDIASSRIGWKEHGLYKLKAVVVHVGDTFSGHFVTYRRGPDNTSLKDKWFYASDAVVREVNINEVLHSNAYMILYERLSV